jgi:purine nucleosidase
MRVHLDTDLGGDPDDVCALAMLLGWSDVELTGITTTIDPGGLRAGMVAHCLELLGRNDVPVAAGAEASLTTLRVAEPMPHYWPSTVAPLPSPPGAALDLLTQSIDQGAIIVAIGPSTNLALLEVARPGSLSRTRIVIMGGWVDPPAAGLPQWGPEDDWNVQWDTRAAEIVAAVADLTLVTLPVTLKAHLRAADLPRLRASGPLGALIARQSELRAEEASFHNLGREYPGLPDDLLNFHYDPLACAVALGWPGVVIEEMRLSPMLEKDVLRFQLDPDGRQIRVVKDVDGSVFSETWLTAVEAAQAQR